MNRDMIAARIDRYGPPEAIVIDRAPVPSPRPGEVLVRVDAAAVTSGDARIRGARFPRGFALPARLALGVRGPRRRTPGAVLAGRIEALGEGVTAFAVGDRVAGMSGARLGAHAAFAVLPATALAAVPEGVDQADAAAALFGGSTALFFLRDRAGISAGQSVLINGASGSVGSAALQLAKAFGATVTAVSSRANHPLLQRLGADVVIDYRATPVGDIAERFDLVFDAVGNLDRRSALGLATADGKVVLAVADLADTITARGRVLAGPAAERSELFADVLARVAKREFDPLTEVVGDLTALPEAHRRIDSGRKVGNLVVVPAS